MEFINIVQILTIHWIADFILQSEKMANNKSHSIKWLSIHILVYSIPLCLFGFKFALINGVCHFITDYFTSKISKYFYNQRSIRNFFIVVGFDQLLHVLTLLGTYIYLGL